MKKSIVLFALILSGFVVNAQQFKGLDKSPMDVAAFPQSHKVSEKIVRITYSRPKLKGRAIETLAPAGKVWRTGANEATEVTFYRDVIFGKEKVKAGIYTLFTIPGEKEWTIILSNQLNAWGSYSYNQAKDVARATAKVTESETELEAFSITFDEKMNLYLGWGKKVISVPVK